MSSELGLSLDFLFGIARSVSYRYKSYTVSKRQAELE